MSGDDATHNDVLCGTITCVVAGDISQISVSGILQQHLDVHAGIDTEITREGYRVEIRGNGWVIKIDWCKAEWRGGPCSRRGQTYAENRTSATEALR